MGGTPLFGLVLQHRNEPWAAPNLKVAAVKDLLGSLDSVRVIFTHQRFEIDNVTVIPEDVDSIFCHGSDVAIWSL
jgi:hypothetical protein